MLHLPLFPLELCSGCLRLRLTLLTSTLPSQAPSQLWVWPALLPADVQGGGQLLALGLPGPSPSVHSGAAPSALGHFTTQRVHSGQGRPPQS